jgi:hypothetical protein
LVIGEDLVVHFKTSLILASLLFSYSVLSLGIRNSCNKFEAYANPEDAKRSGMISDEKNNGEQLGPTRNQDSVGFCYAYAAADMTEAWMKKNGHMSVDQNVSAMAMALQYEEGGNQFAKGLDSYRGQMQRREQMSGALAGYNEEVARMREELTELEDERYRALKSISLNKRSDMQKNEQSVARGSRGAGHSKNQSLGNSGEEIARKISENKLYQGMKKVAEDVLKKAREMQSEHNTSAGTSTPRGSQESGALSLDQMDEEIRRRQNTIEGYLDLIETLQDQINEIDGSSLDDLVPSGGFTSQALNNSWPKVCWESEVSSRDARIKEIYEQERELFSSMAFTPNNLAAVLGNIALVEDAQSQPQAACGYYHVFKSMFPGLPFNDSNTMMDFFTRLDLRSNMFDDILDQSCEEKSLPTRPVAHSITVNHTHPIQNNNDDVFAKIDETLEKGDIAGISYRSSLFSKNDFASEESSDYHASVLVGKMNVCGEEHYILRNSWGQDSCERNQRHFQSTEITPEESQQVRRDESVCRVERESFLNIESPKCPGGEAGLSCREELLNESNMFYGSCMRTIAAEKYEKQNHQYFCDDDGNFIVSKDYLKSATYSVDFISN